MSFFSLSKGQNLYFSFETFDRLEDFSSCFQFYHFVRAWLHFLTRHANPEAKTQGLLTLNVSDYSCPCGTIFRAKIRQKGQTPQGRASTTV